MTWTTKEINQVIRLRKAGCTTPEIAAMLGIPESRAKGYISVLVAQGKIPRMDELPAPRYFPETVDHRIRLLINRVMDWVWAHPKTEFEIISSIAGKYFKLAFYEDDVHTTYVKVGEDERWSQFKYCNVENLQKLIAALKLIDMEDKQ